MTLMRRQPADLIHHSSQGCPYTSIALCVPCQEAGVRPSMSSVGDAYDSALGESFFATLECELLDRRRFRDHAATSPAVFDVIEGWYKSRRRHSGLVYLSPILRGVARNQRSHNDLRIDDRPGRCYLGIPLDAGAVTVSKAVHPPPNRASSTLQSGSWAPRRER
jgi:hypothetical protein